MSLVHAQWFDLSIIVFVAIGLTAFHFGSRKKANALKAILAGLACSVFGVGLACLRGKDCYDVLALIDASGFARAYVFGLGIILAGILIGLAGLFIRGQGRKD